MHLVVGDIRTKKHLGCEGGMSAHSLGSMRLAKNADWLAVLIADGIG
jgi:hypothetical protein